MNESPVFADFWLEQEVFSDYIDPSNKTSDQIFSIDLIQLVSVRRIISNYVDILTNKNIPVYFKSSGDSFNVEGKEIYITTEIKRRKDFDNAVGLALHEAAHTVLSDFNLIKIIPFHVPPAIWTFGKQKNVRKQTLERFIKTMVNMVEDWYIDDWVLSRSPGYVGYYQASYDSCFNTPEINDILISNSYRYPSLLSYEFRIINFCNPLTDLMALPGLDIIAKTIDLTNISRLSTTKQRIHIAFKIVEIVLENIEKFHDDKSQTSNCKIQSIDSFFKNNNKKQEITETDLVARDISNIMANKPKEEDQENAAIVSQISKNPEKSISKEAQAVIQKQIEYVRGEVKKAELLPLQKTMLDIIERHGISLVYIPIQTGNDAIFKVPCIVVKKLTMDLILSGINTFPLGTFWRDEKSIPQPPNEIAEAVQKGIDLGNKLGKRLLIRREVRREKNIHKKTGVINRRLLFSSDFAEDIFQKIHIIRFSKGSLHITVDASSSMAGVKWLETIKTTVAICKATSMVDDIHVTVSFRASQMLQNTLMPYIILAYDSSKDKFSKVSNLFRFLQPNGATPEGLAFASIMDLFTKSSPDEEDRYFLNISDGEPCFLMNSSLTNETFDYNDISGVEHTKKQVDKIRNQGTKILSYYVHDSSVKSENALKYSQPSKNFMRMYGKDAKSINSKNVEELAKTINQLFLKNV